ncbi:MAG TPA: response regulator transcription factor [Candidatus Eisenbacteria bacterium]|nr:response regulator transcription factor [Candidatus Eisenbacteria bacterium]
MVPMPDRVPVYISAGDPISHAGIASQLRGAGITRIADAAVPGAVALVVADQVDGETVTAIRSLRARGAERLILLVARIDDKGVLAAVEAGATNVLRRSEATPANLLAAIQTASAGEGSLPPDLLGRLLSQVGRLQRQVLHPRGLTFAGLTDREVRVLQLLAEGLDTAEVGKHLFYSERTVKNIIHDLTSRLELRNRTHAVAYAIREGLI